MNEICKLVNVSKFYNEFENILAVKNVNLCIRKGDFISIEGISGTGKSTLLHLMSTILKPSEGKIFYNNIDLNSLSDSKIANLRATKIGYILQEVCFLQALNVRDNLLFAAKMNKSNNNKSIEEKMDYYLKKLNLYDKKLLYPSQLSGGQKRRAMIIAALLKNPQIIFADEPTNDLDDFMADEVISLLKEEVANSKAVVIVTHNTRISKKVNIRYKINNGILEKITN